MKAVIPIALCVSLLTANAMRLPFAGSNFSGIHLTSKDKDGSPYFVEHHPKPPQPPKPPAPPPPPKPPAPPKPPKPPWHPSPTPPLPEEPQQPNPTPSASPSPTSTSAADNWRDY